MNEHLLKINCFNPIYDKGNLIYLLTYDISKNSDYRYSIVEYNIDSCEFNLLPSSGSGPKKRSDSILS